MKTAIKLVLIDLLIAQIVAPILIMIPCTIYLFVTTGNLDKVHSDANDYDSGTTSRSDYDGYLSMESRLYQ